MTLTTHNTTVSMQGATESQIIAAVAVGVGTSIREQQDILSRASLPALIGAKLHIPPVDTYALTILDCHISAKKRASK